MRKLVYNAMPLFTEIYARLEAGERVVSIICDLPDCNKRQGKIYFYKSGTGVVVGICSLDNKKDIVYHKDNRDLAYLVKHQAILYDNIWQVMNLFFRMDAIYTSDAYHLTYYVDGYGYWYNGKYRFEFVKCDGGWRAYSLEMPSLEGRDGACSITHRLSDGDRKYICVQGQVPTREMMCKIAKVWATKVQNYIKTGQRF